MASTSKRAWKLQELVAHGANVNCLALGKKSGRVMVTGGDDKKVNLWAVGKPNCLMSLCGHTTPVECVRFGHSEDLVCAGAMSGALKIWDLEAAKIVKTLTGHKANIKCIDFHPYGEFLASGSVDTNIKLWDIRRKGCIFTYKGHKHTVNSLKFSPDGRWIASSGDDGVVKLWDLPAGKMLAEFVGHTAPVGDVQFHPNEFLLASGSLDKTVKFWDLESFQLVSTTEGDTSAIRCIYFHPDGECLYSGASDVLRVYGWEPARVHDSLDIKWGKIADMSMTQNQLIGASYHAMQVSLYIVDLKRVNPFGNTNHQSMSTSSLQSGTPTRKSFIRRPTTLRTKNSQSIPIKTSEDNEATTPDTDPGDNSMPHVPMKDPFDYVEIFQPRRRELTRTPPPRNVDPFLSPFFEEEPTKPDSMPISQPPQRIQPEPVVTDTRRSPPTRPEIVRPYAVRPEPQQQLPPRQPLRPPQQPSPIHHQYAVESVQTDTYRIEQHYATETTTTAMRQVIAEPYNNRVSQPPRPVMPPPTPVVHHQVEPRIPATPIETAVPRPIPAVMSHPNITKREKSSPTVEILSRKHPSDISSSNSLDFDSDKIDKNERIDFIPTQRDHSLGLDVDEFLPSSLKRYHDPLGLGGQQQPELSEAEAISSILKGHDSMVAVLTNRMRNIQIIHTLWTNKDLKTALESAVHMNDQSVVVDILNNICLKPSIWNLDVCATLLPSIFDLIQSRYETYMTAGCSALRIVLKNFGNVIRSNISAPPSIGIDLSREERYNKCLTCYNQLVSVRAFILKRQTLQGKLGHTFRELHILLQALD